MRSPLRRLLPVLLSAAVVLTGVAPATAQPGATAAASVPAVSYADVLPHLQAFQRIAEGNGGNRAHGTRGFKESLDYVKARLDLAGFRTTVQKFRHDGKDGFNLIADWPGGDESRTVFLGAHLDSVPEGPGLNDNGSGSAALLTTALTVARNKLPTDRHLRFAWWGAEESGLVGSRHYVGGLTPVQREKIEVYLNFDMVATPKPQFFIVIDTGTPATPLFQKYFKDRGKETFEVGAGGGSDHTAFHEKGVPTGGFMTPLDDCYHKACDTLANLDPEVQTMSTNAMITAVWGLAQDPAGVGDPYYPKDGNSGYQVEHYDVNIDYNPAKPDELTGDTTVTAIAQRDLDLFHLDLNGFTVDSTTVDGAQAANRREAEHELVITPKQRIRKGGKFKVRVRYSGKHGTEGWKPIQGGGFSASGEPHSAASWYPANDHPSDKATFSLTATVPDGWTAVGNGKPGQTSKAGGRSTFRWHEDQPMATYLSTVAVDKFTLRTSTLKDGKPAIYAWGSGTTPEPESEALMQPMLDYFSSLFGPYPFSSTGGIIVNASGLGALETQSRPTYSGGMWDASMAHELTHQWFGNAVSVADWRNACLNECVAQYANQLWEERNGADLDKGFYRGMIEENRTKPEFWNVPLYDPGPGKELDPALYSKGSVMMHALRRTVGDQAFFGLLKRWIREHNGGNATWLQFEALAQQVSGKDLRGFFDAWARGKVIPAEKYLYPNGK
ncbi:M28 family peptidase [Crossiella sp. CA198]|uniref:M28 family peptidase n=1 Tax=Crossiella sp. CA198 TaxID=3455607 RepID=UPI003F8CFB0A